MTRSWVDTCTF